MRGKLNVFQVGMLRWRELYPYNAVHVLRVSRPLDAARLQQLIAARLVALGLTGLKLDAVRARYEYTGGPAAAPLRVLDGGTALQAIVDREIEYQLNEPFAGDSAIEPFRFFAVDAGTSFYLGLAYDHFIAGGDSIVLLLRGLYEAYLGADADGIAPLDRYPPGFRRLLLRHPWRVLRGLRLAFAALASGRRAFRPRYPGGDDGTNGFASLSLTEQETSGLKAAARAWNVTQNELLLALLLAALVPLTEERRAEPRRNQLAVASIINLRSEFATAADSFGQFLSSFHVIHPMLPGIALESLARAIHAQTAAVKRERRYYQSLLGIGLTNAITCRIRPERRGRFHRKSFPLWAGTTPLNVDTLWSSRAHRPGRCAADGEKEPAALAPEYLRGVSTGPVTPLVAAVTNSANAVRIGLSYRRTAFTVENIDKIIAGIRTSIRTLPA